MTINHSQRSVYSWAAEKAASRLGRSRRSDARIAVLSGAAFSRACASVIEPRSSPRRRVTHAWRTSTTDTTRITAATSSSTTTVVNHMSRELTNTPHPSPPGRGARVRVRRGPGPWRRTHLLLLPSEHDSRRSSRDRSSLEDRTAPNNEADPRDGHPHSTLAWASTRQPPPIPRPRRLLSLRERQQAPVADLVAAQGRKGAGQTKSTPDRWLRVIAPSRMRLLVGGPSQRRDVRCRFTGREAARSPSRLSCRLVRCQRVFATAGDRSRARLLRSRRPLPSW